MVVESDEAKQRLHDSFANKHQFNQHHAKEASHTILFAYDPKFTKEKFVKRVDAEVASGHLPEDMRENLMGATHLRKRTPMTMAITRRGPKLKFI